MSHMRFFFWENSLLVTLAYLIFLLCFDYKKRIQSVSNPDFIMAI